MSKEQRRETFRNLFTVGRAKSFIIGGIAAAAFVLSAEGCQESDKTHLPESSPVSTRFAPEPPKITFDSPEAKKKTEVEAFYKKIEDTLSFMDSSEIPAISNTSAKWKKLITEKSLSISPLDSWIEGGSIDMGSSGNNLRFSIKIAPEIALDNNLGYESAAVLIIAMDRQMEKLSELLKKYSQTRNIDYKTAIGEISKDPNIVQINALLNAASWEEALKDAYFSQQTIDKGSVVGRIANTYKSCKETADFYRCWVKSFIPQKSPTASNINRTDEQVRISSNNSHVAQS